MFEYVILLALFEKYHLSYYTAILKFQEKSFSTKVLFLPKILKNKRKTDENVIFEILGDKYKPFRRHLEYRCNFDFLRTGNNLKIEKCKNYNISKN
jgi:hypothetical protein